MAVRHGAVRPEFLFASRFRILGGKGMTTMLYNIDICIYGIRFKTLPELIHRRKWQRKQIEVVKPMPDGLVSATGEVQVKASLGCGG